MLGGIATPLRAKSSSCGESLALPISFCCRWLGRGMVEFLPFCTRADLICRATLNGTDTMLCHQLPLYGTGDVVNDKYDESGYLALPPCLWGKDEGLIPGIWLPANTPVWSIKQNVNTHMGHFGEMASWQMRGVRHATALPCLVQCPPSHIFTRSRSPLVFVVQHCTH
jgi:hypothetical protein